MCRKHNSAAVHAQKTHYTLFQKSISVLQFLFTLGNKIITESLHFFTLNVFYSYAESAENIGLWFCLFHCLIIIKAQLYASLLTQIYKEIFLRKAAFFPVS